MRCSSFALFVTLAVVGTGCQPATAPAPPPPTGNAPSAPTPEPSATTQFRLFDAAAERELQQQFGTTESQRVAAKAKYAGQRWRFRGKMTSLWAAQRNRFNMLTATVEPVGLIPVYFQFRSEEEKKKAQVGEQYVFEGLVDDYVEGDAIHLQDGHIVLDGSPLLASTTPAVDPADQRSAWHYVKAPLIFPGQTVTEGTFRKQGELWMEERVGDQPQDWKETARNPEFVELSRPAGDFMVRLFNDHSDYRRSGETKWTAMFPGQWETPPK